MTRNITELLTYIFFINVLTNFVVTGQSGNESEKLIFDHLKVTDGLSQSWAITINQDQDGFIWIGTRDGLNRYDSRNFVVYRSDPKDSLTLDSNHVSSIYFDSKDRMWIGSANGLNLYNKEIDNFKRISDQNKLQHQGRMYIHNILEDSKGMIWYTSDRGLHNYDPMTEEQSDLVISNNDIPESSTTQMKALIIDQDNQLWVGIENGLVKLDLSKNKNLIIPLIIKLPLSNQDKEYGLVNDIVEYPKGTFWLATETGGFLKFEIKDSKFEQFSRQTTKGGLINDHVRRLMVEDATQRLWLGTRNGLAIYDINSGRFYSYQNEIDNPSSLSDNSIHSIFKDRDGSYWLGTYHGGVNIYNDSFFKITTYRVGKYNQGLNYSAVSAINETRTDKLLFGTEGGGINIYDKQTGNYRYFQHRVNDATSLSHNNVKCIQKDLEGEFWVGTSGGGICQFNPEEGKFTRFDQQQIGVRKEAGWVYSIDVDQDGVLWIANFRVGLVAYDKRTKEYKLFEASNEKESIVSNLIRKVLVDSKNRIWIGTDDGLTLYEKENNKFTTFLKGTGNGSLQSSGVFSIYEDSRQNIWIGTFGGGLNRYIEGSETFEVFNTKDGLPGNNIFGILEDEDGAIWLSTNSGISKFNPDQRRFKNFTTQDGLLDMEYGYNAYFKSESGELFFGGRNGLISFYPGQVQENTVSPQSVITHFKLFNKPVNAGDHHDILKKQIVATDHITLNHTQNVFTLEFSVLNYIKSSKNKYAYRLVGLEEEWNYVNVPSATYTNLKPGDYTFLVKGANNDGIWNEIPAKLEISVLPAPWKTIWAYSLYFFILVAAMITLFRYQKIKVSLEHDLKMRGIENRRQKELSQAKLRFFTDISHEIRTPLTLILTPLETLISDNRSDVRLYKQLIGIKDNADRLLRLVNQLLDFRKKDSKDIRLRVAEGNIVKFINEIHLAFQEQAIRKKVTLDFNSDFQELKVYYDRDELEKVFFNLINNAIKYSHEGGRIDVEIKHSENPMTSEPQDMVSITIRDNGIGINAEDIEKIFERYYNSNHSGISKLSTGIGLSLSKKIVDAHSGKITCASTQSDNSDDSCTTFTVYLPLGRNHFNASEIIEDFKDSENIDTYHYLFKQFDDMVIPLPGEDQPPLEPKKYTLLIAEDNNDIRSFVAGHLSEDYNIVETENGQKALSTAYETIPDLIIADVIMPKMDGLKLCSLIKNDERTSHIPVIILSARTALIHKVDGLENGADEYITKPFNMRLMKAKIRNLIRSREIMREKFSQEFILKPENIVLSSPDVKFLKRVKDLIEEHISDPDFNVDFFSKEIGMSRPVLYRKIRAVTDMSVVELINTYRLEKAAEVLKSNHYNIAEIAAQVGFSDPKYFSKAFRKKYGVSPSQYLNHEIE